jgi:pimeloyl-ACP methyl ester carboxylesterase
VCSSDLIVTAVAQLSFLDWETGRTGALTAAGKDTFWAPPSPAKGDVRQTVIVFGRDTAGRIADLSLREGKAKAVRAERRETFRQEAAEFANGKVALSGTLKRPLGQGPHPAVVLVHGSGPGTREQVEAMASFFVHLGMATLSYDKRGCGDSGGDWKAVDLEVLADDALAGVEWLQVQPGIDPLRVGIWGISQGGWIGPLAAARSDQVAFVVNHSGPGTSLRRQDTYMMANVLKAQEVPDHDIALAISAMNAIYDYVLGGTTTATLDAAIDSLRGKPGLEDFAAYSSSTMVPDSLYAHQALGDPAWFFHLDPDRDALEPYRTLRCPILVVYGALDTTVPIQESAEGITATLDEAGHPDFRIEVLKCTGHGPVVMLSDQPETPAEPVRVALEYFALLEGWLKDRGFVGEGE